MKRISTIPNQSNESSLGCFWLGWVVCFCCFVCLDPTGEIKEVDEMIPRRSGQSEKKGTSKRNALNWLKMNCKEEE